MRNIILLVLLAAANAEHINIGFSKNVLQPFKPSASVSLLERTGKPSMKPTRTPESSPSAEPTQIPTYKSGWLVKNQNSGDCDSNPDSVFALRTGTCIKSYADADSEETPYYIQATCYTDEVLIERFTDEECTDLIEGDFGIELGCVTEESEFSTFTSAYTYCTEGDHLPLSDFVSYSILLGYENNDDTCADDNIVKMQAFRENSCIIKEGLEESVAIIFPDIYVYPGQIDCNGTDFEIVPLRSPDECVVLQDLMEFNGTSWYADANITEGALDNYYGDYAHATQNLEGSVKWVSYEGSEDEFYIIGKQNLAGILPTDFNDNFEVNQAIFGAAIATTIGHGITEKDVTVTQLDLDISALRRRLSEGSTDVTYKVSYEASKLNFYTEEESYEVLSTALITGVESGNFTDYLQEWNAALQEQNIMGDLGECSSESVKVSYKDSPDVDDDNDGSKWANRASANIISGVLVGLGIVVLVGLGYFVFKQCSSSKE